MNLPSPEKFKEALDKMDQNKLHEILENMANEINEIDQNNHQSKNNGFEIILDPDQL